MFLENHTTFLYRNKDFEFHSPLERAFAEDWLKWANPDPKVFYQHPVTIYWPVRGYEVEEINIRFDYFVIFSRKGKEYRMNIELDSVTWHDEEKDYWRDYMVLLSRVADEVLRIHSSGPLFCNEDYLYPVSKFVPELFTEQSRQSVETAASSTMKEPEYGENVMSVDLPTEYVAEDEKPRRVKIQRRTLKHIEDKLLWMYRES